MNAKEFSEVIKNYAEAAAVLGAGVYFLVKAFQGFEIIDASLTLKADRRTAAGGNDYLAVTVTLKRGTKGGLRLHDAEITVNQGDAVQLLKPDIRRLTFDEKSDPKNLVRLQSRTSPTLNLAPGEEASFAVLCQVKTNEPCIIDATVIGKKFWSLVTGQWRSSVVSLPLQTLSI